MMATGAGRLMHILRGCFSDVFLLGFLGWSYLAVIGFGVGGNQVREISRVAEWSLCFRAIFTSYFHCCPFSSCIRAPPSSHRRDAYGLGGRHHPGASYESHTLRDGIRHAPLLRNSQNAGRAGGAGCVVPPKAHWISSPCYPWNLLGPQQGLHHPYLFVLCGFSQDQPSSHTAGLCAYQRRNHIHSPLGREPLALLGMPTISAGGTTGTQSYGPK